MFTSSCDDHIPKIDESLPIGAESTLNKINALDL